jgi:excisionase family DNA binding protein
MIPLTTLAHRLEPLLARRLEQLTCAVEQGDASAWPLVERTIMALESLGRLALPEQRGELLTVHELAARLGVTAKSALRMVAEGRLTPAVRSGRFLRFRGDERPQGPARARTRDSGPPVASGVAIVAGSDRNHTRSHSLSGAVSGRE